MCAKPCAIAPLPLLLKIDGEEVKVYLKNASILIKKTLDGRVRGTPMHACVSML